MSNDTYKYKLFADYFQFYLQDEAAEGDLSGLQVSVVVRQWRGALGTYAISAYEWPAVKPRLAGMRR